jgi:lysyl-tRNA synthetase class 2
MDFIIEDAIFNKYPNYICGFIAAKNVDNAGTSGELLAMIKAAQEEIKSQMTLENLSQNPFIRNWRDIYSSFKAQPSKFKASSEALIRRTLKGDEIPHINKLVDIYNYISLKYRTPVGGEDISKITSPVWLKFAKGNERFIKLGETEDDPIEAGEVVYIDASDSVLCRRWNWRESETTKLTEETKDAILVIDATAPLTAESVMAATKELADLVRKFCGGARQVALLSNKERKVSF